MKIDNENYISLTDLERYKNSTYFRMLLKSG